MSQEFRFVPVLAYTRLKYCSTGCTLKLYCNCSFLTGFWRWLYCPRFVITSCSWDRTRYQLLHFSAHILTRLCSAKKKKKSACFKKWTIVKSLLSLHCKALTKQYYKFIGNMYTKQCLRSNLHFVWIHSCKNWKNILTIFGRQVPSEQHFWTVVTLWFHTAAKIKSLLKIFKYIQLVQWVGLKQLCVHG